MLNGIGADLQCKFILLTEDALHRLKITMESDILFSSAKSRRCTSYSPMSCGSMEDLFKQIRVKDISFSAILGIEEMCTAIL